MSDWIKGRPLEGQYPEGTAFWIYIDKRVSITRTPWESWAKGMAPYHIPICPPRPPSPEMDPCPFCGSTLLRQHYSYGDFSVECKACNAIGPAAPFLASALGRWNKAKR